MPNTVAFTIALGDAAREGARLTRRTFQAVHPDIPFFIIEGDFYRFFAQQETAGHAGEIVALRTLVGYFLALAFDRVVYLDSDVLVISPLPRLVEGSDPVTLTNDLRQSTYGVSTPLINAGVLAASSAPFWGDWMLSLYAYLLPISEHFFDQFILRVLCENRAFPYVLLPEREEKDYYNLTYREEPGEWRWDGGALHKGEGRVRLWHWAGHRGKPTLAELPPPVRAAVEARLAAPSSDGMAEEGLLKDVIRRNGEPFLKMVVAEFQKLESVCFEGEVSPPSPHPGIYGTDAPESWDGLRPPPPGFHRRLLPRANRYLYAREEARLHAPDADALDRPPLR